MNDNWKTYPRAPAAGAVVCAASEAPARGVVSLSVNGFPILLGRSGGGLVAYVNACPHQFLPLDYRSASILSADGRVLRCSNHEAGFDLATGKGVDGFGAGCALASVPIREDAEGRVIIDER